MPFHVHQEHNSDYIYLLIVACNIDRTSRGNLFSQNFRNTWKIKKIQIFKSRWWTMFCDKYIWYWIL